MPLRRLPSAFLLLLALQIPLPGSQASPIPPPPRELARHLLSSPPSIPPPQDTTFSLIRRAEEHDVPLVRPTQTTTYVSFAEASAQPEPETSQMTSPFGSGSEGGSSSSGGGTESSPVASDGYSASKPLAPGVLGAIVGFVVLGMILALWALYRSQRRKNRSRRELTDRQQNDKPESVRSEGESRKERQGSCSSQGTMVEVDGMGGGGGLGKKISPVPTSGLA